MKDFRGNELSVGDKVVYIQTTGSTHTGTQLRTGTITEIKKVIGDICVIDGQNIRDTHKKVMKL